MRRLLIYLMLPHGASDIIRGMLQSAMREHTERAQAHAAAGDLRSRDISAGCYDELRRILRFFHESNWA